MADNTVTKTLSYDGKEYEVVREGLAEILNLRTPPRENGGQKPSQTVFYNPIQQFNRDLSVLAIRTFAEHLAYSRRLRKEKETRRPKHAGRKGQRKTAEATAVSEHGSKRKRDADEEVTDEPQVKSAKREAVNEGSSGGVNGDGEEATNQHSRDHDQELDGVPKGPKGDGQSVDKDIQSNKSRFRILDALSATGLRALRYAKEIPSATDITSNDLSPSATESVKTNIRHNDVAKIVHPTTGDARAHMYESASASLYHVIDLDPYGTAAPFFDAAVQALADGGLLCVTCTDAGVFASVGYLEKTYSQYNGLPFKGTQSHEGGLRLILHAIATSAARYGMAIEPLLSLSIDFYARVFVRIRKSPAEVKFLASKTMLVYNCDSGCGAWTTQNLAQTKERQAKNGDPCYAFSLAQGPSASPYCEHCGFKTHVTGPMWGGPLHNPYFIQKILDILPSLDKEVYGTTPRLEGMLTLALNETIFDDPAGQTAVADEPLPVAEDLPFPSLDPKQLIHHPFFILPSQLAKVVHSVAPSDAAFRGALLHLGKSLPLFSNVNAYRKTTSRINEIPLAQNPSRNHC